MDDELFRMLGLDSAPPAGPIAEDVTDAGPDEAERSPYAFTTDEWAARRGRELAECPRFEATGGSVEDASDCFTAAFDPCPELQPCADLFKGQFFSALLETADYAALASETELNDVAAQIAALHFADELAAARPKTAPPEDATPAEKAKAKETGELAATLAAGRAAKAAAEEVAEYADYAAAGMGEGKPGERLSPAAMAAAFQRFRTNPQLRRICELAGRMRRVAQSRQRQKTDHGQDEMIGVEPGGDVARLLPHELAKLAVPELELDTLRRIVERQALCREYAAVEPAGRGPILVTVDESGSMQGKKVEAAKALALTLAWLARAQKRWVALVAYSGDSGERILPIAPGQWDQAAVSEWLLGFIGRGSNIDVPVRELPRMYADLKAPAGQTDVVMITDAVCRLPAAIVETFRSWRTAVKANVIGIVIDEAPGDFVQVCHETHVVRGLDAETPAVGRILSI